MNLRRWLPSVFVLLMLGGCTVSAPGQGQAPYAPYPPETDRHTHGGVDI